MMKLKRFNKQNVKYIFQVMTNFPHLVVCHFICLNKTNLGQKRVQLRPALRKVQLVCAIDLVYDWFGFM